MGEHWFEPIADHLGRAYLRYSFTKGTEQEVGFLVEALGLGPGMRVLDAGCGPGRHSHALARRGIEVVGVDISERFVELARADAPPGATFVRGDIRELGFEAEFDVALTLCQGGFGLLDDLEQDLAALDGLARALRPGGHLVLSAFNAFFRVRYPGEDVFDIATGIDHEVTVVKDEQGTDKRVELHTTCFTPRELRLLARAAGLEVVGVYGVDPGDYDARPPDVERTEHLLVARRRESVA